MEKINSGTGAQLTAQEVVQLSLKTHLSECQMSVPK